MYARVRCMQSWSKAKQALAGEGQSKLRLYYVSHLSPPIREDFLPLLLFVELHLGRWNASHCVLILTLAFGLDLFALAATLSEALLLRATPIVFRTTTSASLLRTRISYPLLPTSDGHLIYMALYTPRRSYYAVRKDK